MFEVRDRILNMKWLMSDKGCPMFELRNRMLNMKRLMSEKENVSASRECPSKKNLQLPD